MGIRYICDVCGKGCDMKGGVSPSGYPYAAEVPNKWVIISYLEPVPQPGPSPGPVGIPERIPKGFLVCSLACAEKALGEARDDLREAFRKVS